ncbi:hypothetical protein EVAR_87413_1 [Eumeta japonica]|uniref:Uncharacterized protein n=1 Tax=Eumeta variegata TaxID=151549 RepID=A0A4C1XGH1_EUMVA|nr:hypothetical protein EVAR_87413_1 [Eumeta japonica]
MVRRISVSCSSSHVFGPSVSAVERSGLLAVLAFVWRSDCRRHLVVVPPSVALSAAAGGLSWALTWATLLASPSPEAARGLYPLGWSANSSGEGRREIVPSSAFFFVFPHRGFHLYQRSFGSARMGSSVIGRPGVTDVTVGTAAGGQADRRGTTAATRFLHRISALLLMLMLGASGGGGILLLADVPPSKTGHRLSLAGCGPWQLAQVVGLEVWCSPPQCDPHRGARTSEVGDS